MTSYGKNIDSLRDKVQHADDVARKHRDAPAQGSREIYDTNRFFSVLSPVETIIGVLGNVVYLHYTIVYFAYLSVVLVAFRFG